MLIDHEPKYDFKDLLIVPNLSTLSSRADVDLTRTFTFLHSMREWTGVPIIAANMDSIATFEMAKALLKHNCCTALHKHYSVDNLVSFFNEISSTEHLIFYSMGTSKSDFSKFEEFVTKFGRAPQNVCIDVANGYTKDFLTFVTKIRDMHPTTTIMAGNVVTAAMTQALVMAGVDIIKIGIGSGSVCTTRLVAGVGYPQLSAIVECANAAHQQGALVCGDGGCTEPGDVAKAFAGGADFVMLGGMLAGHDECGGQMCDENGNPITGKLKSEVEVIVQQSRNPIWDTVNTIKRFYNRFTGESFVVELDDTGKILSGQSPPVSWYDTPKGSKMKFYGMSSTTAMEKYSGGVADYRASEGREVLVPYRGPVGDTIKTILGGVRSACTYTGSRKLKELSKRTTFVRVNQTHNQIYEKDTTRR